MQVIHVVGIIGVKGRVDRGEAGIGNRSGGQATVFTGVVGAVDLQIIVG